MFNDKLTTSLSYAQKFKWCIALFAVLFISGCATKWATVSPVNQQRVIYGVTIDFPTGWNFQHLKMENAHVASLDSPLLNAIVFEYYDARKLSVNTETERLHNVDRENDIAASNFVKYWQYKNGVENAFIEETKTKTQDGKNFFYVEWTFTDEQSAKIRCAAQGTIIHQKFVFAWFLAPEMHYFDEHIETFRASADTMRYAGL